MDRRQQKTRQAVYQALTKLLEQKSYNAITVQEIIDEANIGRSTFYSHFETKDQLVKIFFNEIFDHVFSDHLTSEKTHDFSGKEHELIHELTHILYHIQDNRSYLCGMLACENGELFMSHFREKLVILFEKAVSTENMDIPADYRLNHMVCDFAETVRWWMQHPDYSPEEIATFFRETTPDMG